MKKISFIVFILALFCGNAKAQWSVHRAPFNDVEPAGTSENRAIWIESEEQLAEFAYRVANGTTYNGKYFKLARDLSLWLYDWDMPIGTSAARPFQGTFDGNNFAISAMRAKMEAYNYSGLFGYTNGAVIKNMTMTGVTDNYYLYEHPSGSLIGYAVGTTVENCSVAGTSNLYQGSSLGGLIGEASESTVINCSSLANVRHLDESISSINMGGLIGTARKTTVTNCSFSGNMENRNGDGSDVTGGLIGYANGVTINECYSEGKIEAESSGGFIGVIEGEENTIRDCSAACQILGKEQGQYVGGFIGKVGNSDVEITDCRASGSIIGLMYNVGGFIGRFEEGSGSITGCISEVSVMGMRGYTGGFMGNVMAKNATTISDCRSTGSTVGDQGVVGGFVGYIPSSPVVTYILRCSAEGPVTGTSVVGGFAGQCLSAHISGCYACGAVKGTNTVGGFAGSVYYDTNVTDCFYVGHVDGNYYVGGFAGSASGAVTDCYSVGRVEGFLQVGGFVGTNNAACTNCFCVSTVIGKNPDDEFLPLYGGFVGIGGTYAPNNCYFDRQLAVVADASGDLDATGIEALPTSELTKNSLTGFSPDKWVFTAGYYPQLKVFAESADMTTRLRSALSVVPLKLANDTETVDDVQTIFPLAEKTPAGDVIAWFADPEEKAVVANLSAYVYASDAWRTLTLRVGMVERTVRFRPAESLITTNMDVYVNGERFKDINTPYTYSISCDSNDETVDAVFVIGDYATHTPVTSMTLHANVPQDVTVETNDGQTKKYTFTAEKRLPSEIFVQRWADVLAINNDPTTNGGYDFTDYQWFKNGVEQPETKGYILLSGSAEYTATLNGRFLATQQNVTRKTCPAVITNTAAKAMIYPNPVQHGQSVHICRGVMHYAHYVPTAADIQLFSPTGNLVIKKTIHDAITEIAMPDTPGQYILQITVNGVGESYKVVVN